MLLPLLLLFQPHEVRQQLVRFFRVEPDCPNLVLEGVPDVSSVIVQQERRFARDGFREWFCAVGAAHDCPARGGRCRRLIVVLVRAIFFGTVGRRGPDAPRGSFAGKSFRRGLGPKVVLLPPGLEFLDGARHVGLFSVDAPRSVVPPGSIPAADRNAVGGVHDVSNAANDANGLECMGVHGAVVQAGGKDVVQHPADEFGLAGKGDDGDLHPVREGGLDQLRIHVPDVRKELLEGSLPVSTSVYV